MTPEQLIKLGAGLQRMADRLERGEKWYGGWFLDEYGIEWELTEAGWQSVIT